MGVPIPSPHALPSTWAGAPSGRSGQCPQGPPGSSHPSSGSGTSLPLSGPTSAARPLCPGGVCDHPAQPGEILQTHQPCGRGRSPPSRASVSRRHPRDAERASELILTPPATWPPERHHQVVSTGAVALRRGPAGAGGPGTASPPHPNPLPLSSPRGRTPSLQAAARRAWL